MAYLVILKKGQDKADRGPVCGNGIMSSDINCQNLGNQVDRDHNSANITGIRPGSSGGFDHDNGSHNGHNDQVSSSSSYILSGN